MVAPSTPVGLVSASPSCPVGLATSARSSITVSPVVVRHPTSVSFSAGSSIVLGTVVAVVSPAFPRTT